MKCELCPKIKCKDLYMLRFNYSEKTLKFDEGRFWIRQVTKKTGEELGYRTRPVSKCVKRILDNNAFGGVPEDPNLNKQGG